MRGFQVLDLVVDKKRPLSMTAIHDSPYNIKFVLIPAYDDIPIEEVDLLRGKDFLDIFLPLG